MRKLKESRRGGRGKKRTGVEEERGREEDRRTGEKKEDTRTKSKKQEQRKEVKDRALPTTDFLCS